jgi:hypothetical protein
MVSLSNHGCEIVVSTENMAYAALRQAQDERMRWLLVRDVLPRKDVGTPLCPSLIPRLR